MELKDWLQIFGTTLTFLTILFGIVQYRKAQKWKRLEFISKEINDFENDMDITNARLMLDWDERTIELHYDVKDMDYNSRFVYVDNFKMKKALTVYDKEQEGSGDFSDDETAIRDTFDELFGYFEGFYANIQTGLVSFDEYYPHIMYWIDILSNPDSNFKDDEFKRLVREFLEYYGYDGVLWIMNEHMRKVKQESA